MKMSESSRLRLQVEQQVHDGEANRDVEHRGRLVGDQAVSGGPRAPVRYPRAGVGHPTARGGSAGETLSPA